MARAIEVPALIEGSAVRLRSLRVADIPAYARAFVEDPGLGPAAGSETDPDEESLRDRPEQAARGATAGRFVELAIADAGDDRLLGSVTLHSFDWRHEHVEVGFWLVRGGRGRGAATEAVALAIEWAFAELGMHRIELITLPALRDFERVAELAARLGFQREGVMRERNLERGRRHDTAIFGLLRADWSGLESGRFAGSRAG
jgi:RimJ/RimL family protein N-acetyltransferase